MKRIRIKSDKEYDFCVGDGILHEVISCALGSIKPFKCAVIADENAAGHHLDTLNGALDGAGVTHVCRVLKSGEGSKSFEEYGKTLAFLAENGICRHDLIIAFGGGVTGDIAGFCAATYMRGVRFVNIPTTLLAAVDSSVGGKCGIDMPGGKNLVGAFKQPEAVICDMRFLKTLDDREIRNGAGEILKYGILADGTLLEAAASREKCLCESVIMRCVTVKSEYIASDERDFGVRRFLNLGHTVAHAAELLSGYTLPHGEAVAYGLSVITHAAERNRLCERGISEAVDAAVCRAGLPTAQTLGFKADELARAAHGDKKRLGDNITLVLPETVGKCRLYELETDFLAGFFACGTGEG